jgi:copper oxidase (laccase) domain-containing protein
MADHRMVAIAAGTVDVVFTERSDGDFRSLSPDAHPDVAPDWAHPHQAALARRRRSIVDAPWTWLRQVHGGRVVYVARPGDQAGAVADAAVTTTPGCPIAVSTADCAPVVLVAEEGVAVVHAGWRGLVAGIVSSAASQLRAVAGPPVATLVGPCINPSAYEFGEPDLAVVSGVLGPAVQGETAWGTPALDVPAAVAAACRRAGWPAPEGEPQCTSGERWYSHRSRGEAGRQATVAWLS